METKIDSLNKIARIAGIGYLVIFVTGIFANFFVLESIVVPNDANATYNNIVKNTTQFRVGFLSFVIMVVFDLVLTWALYVIFEPVNRKLSLFAAWFRLVNTAIFGVALFALFNVLHLTSGVEYLNVFEPAQLQARVMLAIENFNYIWLIGLLFFGIHLAALGYLILQSKFIANFIGILLMAASLGYVIDSIAHFMMPDYDDYKAVFSMVVVIPGVVGELSFTLWLLIRGVKQRERVKK